MLKISSNLKQFCKIYCWSWHMGSRIWNIFFSNQILNKHTTLSLLFYFLSFYFLLCLNNFQSIQELDWKGCVGYGSGGYEHPPSSLTHSVSGSEEYLYSWFGCIRWHFTCVWLYRYMFIITWVLMVQTRKGPRVSLCEQIVIHLPMYFTYLHWDL